MTEINKTNILTRLQANIDAISAVTSAKSVFIAALSADVISQNRSITVNTVADLPNLYDVSIPDAQVVFVNSINLPVIANQYKWLGLDGRLLRDDFRPSAVWTWGTNSAGQLGDNTQVSRSSPVSVVGGFTDWCQVSAGGLHTAAVRTNCTLWAWGCNSFGQLGVNSTINACSPVSVVGGFLDWCHISAGGFHTAALRTNGTIWTWGRNHYGQLGSNTTVSKSSPVSVVGGFSDWCQVAASSNAHTVAIRTNGTIWTWGYNYSGQLGDNTTVSKSSPVSIVGGFTDWCQVSAGGFHTAAVRTNGTLWAWGEGTYGRLGDNTITNKSSPVQVVGGFTDWCQVSAGRVQTAAVRTNGTLWTWGCNGAGQLGDNTVVSRSSPVSVVGGFTDWCQVSAGFVHTAAIRNNGTIWTWGYNGTGQLGDNTIISKRSPVSLVGGFTNWCQVSVSNLHTAAIRVG